MDVELSEAQRLIRDTVREFTRREIAPIADAIDREDRFPRELWPKLGALGVLGINAPEAYGGAGADLLAGVLAIEEMGKASASVALSYGAHANLCVNTLTVNGTAEQKQRYLPPLCAGTHVGALALTEPEAGSDAVGIRTTARREGDVYVLNGRKMFITNGSVADTLVLYAKTEPEAGSRGITAFVIEKGFAGFAVGQTLDKLGHRGSPTAELILDDCQVPAGNILGELNRGVRGDDAGAGDRAGIPFGAVHRHGGGGAGGQHCLRAGAQAVRAADRRLPADSGQAGGHVHGD